MLGEALDSSALFIRSAKNHLRYFTPAAQLSPELYCGKVESSILTLLLDIYGQKVSDLADINSFSRFCSAFNQQWRAYDEVIDEEKADALSMTAEDLDNTPVIHPLLNTTITGGESMQLALNYAEDYLRADHRNTADTRSEVEQTILDFRQTVVEVMNDSRFRMHGILPFTLAYEMKLRTTGILSKTGAELYALLLGRSDTNGKELFFHGSMAMQIGDDLLDWRRDWLKYQKKSPNHPNLRPIENLVVSTVSEDCEEFSELSGALERNVPAYKLLKTIGPNSLKTVSDRFSAELAMSPKHPYADRMIGVVNFTFKHILPRIPESGRFVKWAKY